jgi:predicted MFS family arabinose efflux permease
VTHETTGRPPVNHRLIWLLALTCGVAVGNVYFPQAVSPLVATGMDISPDAAAAVVTAVQLGYTTGIFLLVPLGDRLPYRRLIVTMLGLAGLALLAASTAPSLPLLIAASALVGATTVVAPIIGAMAAGLVAEDRRGAVSGLLLSGSIGGMLLSRTVGGAAGQWWGWQAPYLVAATLTLLIAVYLACALPATPPATPQRYPALLAEPLRLLRIEPQLRRSCVNQAMVFAAFSAVWTGVAMLLTGPVYGLGAHAVGVLALVNGVTMLVTPVAGRRVDRRGPDEVNIVCLLGVVASAAVLAFGGLGGTAGLAALALGSMLLDVAVQSGMVANQVRIYTLRPLARARLNTAYMTCGYIGGTIGSWLGARAYAHLGWAGVALLVALLTAAAVIHHLTSVASVTRMAARHPQPPHAHARQALASTVEGGLSARCAQTVALPRRRRRDLMNLRPVGQEPTCQ